MTTNDSPCVFIMRVFLKGPILFFFAAMIVILSYYMMTQPKRAVKDVIRQARRAVEAEDTAAVMGWMTDDYLDAYGYRVTDIRTVLRDLFAEMDGITITILDEEITVEEDTAGAVVTFRVLATLKNGMRGYVAGNPKYPVRVTVNMEKTRGGWRVRRISRIETVY